MKLSAERPETCGPGSLQGAGGIEHRAKHHLPVVCASRRSLDVSDLTEKPALGKMIHVCNYDKTA